MAASLENKRSRVNIRLPKVDLPEFDGNITKWLNFKELLFETAVHNNDSLNKIDKLIYRKANLTGKASENIRTANNGLELRKCVAVAAEFIWRQAKTDIKLHEQASEVTGCYRW